ncbi:MAG: hypothetical protein IPO62_08250 [Saprospiraceae bacterium]|nr:hypothetical protein [Saprospiraceae bacterium]MBK9631044.1 hypothetical protein [Saprospiraceae bacterium]
MKYKQFYIVICVFFHTFWTQGQSNNQAIPILGVKMEHSDCFEACYELVIFKDNSRQSDSIINECLVASLTAQQIDKFCLQFAEYVILFKQFDFQSEKITKIVKIAQELLLGDLSNENKWSLYRSLSEYYFEIKNAEKCLLYASHSLTISKEFESAQKLSLSLISLGKSMRLKNSPAEALKNFLEALFLALQSKNKNIEYLANIELAEFFYELKIFDKGLQYTNEVVRLSSNQNLFDSTTFYYNKLYQLDFICKINLGEFNIDSLKAIVSFSIRNGQDRLNKYCMAFLRSTKLAFGLSENLLDVFQFNFPSEFQKLISKDSLTLFRLLAYQYQGQNQKDSAQYYYNKLFANLVTESQDPGFLNILYLNYAEHLATVSQINRAINYFELSYKYGISSGINTNKSRTLEKMVEFFIKNKNYKEALEYKQKLQEINSTINESRHSLEIFKIEAQFMEKVLLQKQLEENNEQNHLHQTQYDLIAIFIVLIFLGLMLMVQYKMPVWLIRSLGFLSFIFLFEFLIIKLDKQIHEITHEVPWKLFSIKVIMIAILLPLHHYVEKKAIQYLVHKRSEAGGLIQINFISRLRNWFQKLNSDNEPN